jgi:diguanylate cyclase (GGDEF)-like protein
VNRRIREVAARDALTGLLNRRSVLAATAVGDARRRRDRALPLVLIDVDHFKRVNDTHGHAVGDLVIQSVADGLRETVRPMDLAARIGGEEFAVILPNCSPAFGQTVADRLRTRIEARPIPIGPSQTLGVTISVGGAYAPQWVRSTASLWTERADLQLYRAKAEGRNRTCLEPTPVSVVSPEEKGLLFGTSNFGEFLE